MAAVGTRMQMTPRALNRRWALELDGDLQLDPSPRQYYKPVTRIVVPRERPQSASSSRSATKALGLARPESAGHYNLMHQSGMLSARIADCHVRINTTVPVFHSRFT